MSEIRVASRYAKALIDLAIERGRVHKKNQWLLKSTLDYKK